VERATWTDERLDARFDRIDHRFDRMEARMEAGFDRIQGRIDTLQSALLRLTVSMSVGFLGMTAGVVAAVLAR
jgi:hypothetical protein